MFSSQNSQVSNDANYIEDVFSTYLYTGNGSTQTITNGIDLSTKGGMVWTKSRTNANEALIYDTVRGVNNYIIPSSTQEAQTSSGTLTAFNSNGFTLGANDNSNDSSTENSVSWTFREAPKFFDVVTYTGDGTTNRSIAHSLGSMPGFIAIKRTDSSGNWACAARYDDSVWYAYYEGTGTRFGFNSTDAGAIGSASAMATSTVFYPRLDGPNTNATAVTNVNGATYVAYIYAHNAGGFGLTGTDNVISCGSFNAASGSVTVTLGYEPQWVMFKETSGGSWRILDNMRGFDLSADDKSLSPNSSTVETSANFANPTATGFITGNQFTTNDTVVYIAIRRGPMKVPTDATKVFTPVVFTDADKLTTAGFPVDTAIEFQNISASNLQYFSNRLTAPKALNSRSTAAETTETQVWASNTQVQLSNQGNSYTRLYHMFRRAPSFMDVVCYTGTGSARTVTHNLGVVPELMIVKRRDSANSWNVYAGDPTKVMYLNGTIANTTYGVWNNTAPTATQFTVSSFTEINASGSTYVAYLFATCAGVSKCTAFTGNGTSQTINCGFTSGARFVMIKATSTTGNWTIFDSARGISAGGDPALYLNSTAAEVTGVDAIDADSTGFIVNQESTFNLNASGVQYLVLAIA